MAKLKTPDHPRGPHPPPLVTRTARTRAQGARPFLHHSPRSRCPPPPWSMLFLPPPGLPIATPSPESHLRRDHGPKFPLSLPFSNDSVVIAHITEPPLLPPRTRLLSPSPRPLRLFPPPSPLERPRYSPRPRRVHHLPQTPSHVASTGGRGIYHAPPASHLPLFNAAQIVQTPAPTLPAPSAHGPSSYASTTRLATPAEHTSARRAYLTVRPDSPPPLYPHPQRRRHPRCPLLLLLLPHPLLPRPQPGSPKPWPAAFFHASRNCRLQHRAPQLCGFHAVTTSRRPRHCTRCSLQPQPLSPREPGLPAPNAPNGYFSTFLSCSCAYPATSHRPLPNTAMTCLLSPQR